MVGATRDLIQALVDIELVGAEDKRLPSPSSGGSLDARLYAPGWASCVVKIELVLEFAFELVASPRCGDGARSTASSNGKALRQGCVRLDW